MAILALAGCGGEDKVDSGASAQELLNKTFTGKKDVKSGKIDVKIDVTITGSGSPLQGPVKLALSGPFESQGTGKLPKFDLDASFNGAGQNLKAGVTSTGEKGFVAFQGTDYEISQQIFSQFRTAYEQAAKQNQGNQNQSLATLGIDPKKWLTDARNEGEEKVGDADTVKLTGKVDISKLLDDVNTALGKASSLGLGAAGADLPTKITDAQKKQVADAVKQLDVQIYTGKDDAILRRMVIALEVADPEQGSNGRAKLNLDFSLLDLNEGQEFTEPENAKPLDQLLQNLGGLGLGGLGGPGGGGSSGGGESGGGESGANFEEYTQCVEEAGGDLEKAQKCAELLTP